MDTYRSDSFEITQGFINDFFLILDLSWLPKFQASVNIFLWGNKRKYCKYNCFR